MTEPKIGMTHRVRRNLLAQVPSNSEKDNAAGVEESYIYGVSPIVKVTDSKVSKIVEAR